MKGIYIVGGYPNLNDFEEILKIADNSDIDFIEIGIPFNDPVADGPVIASAIQKVVDNKTSLNDLIKIIKKYRNKTLLAMTYANIIYDYGYQKFSNDFEEIFDGLIIPDIPNKYHEKIQKEGLKIPLVPFVTPETRESDLEKLSSVKSPFIYYVGVRGVTGGKANYDLEQMNENIQNIKKHTNKPVIIGFGIKTKEDTEKVMTVADGFVVGTEIVKLQDNSLKFKDLLDKLF
jgi:tryptophan synthase alpha chain